MEYYKEVLQQEYERRNVKNPSFSLRSYAKFLDIPSTTLISVLNNKRHLPQSYIDKIIDKLQLHEEQSIFFKRSVHLSKKSLREISAIEVDNTDSRVFCEEQDFNIIAHWEYLAFINLLQTANFIDDDIAVASRLGITQEQVKQIKIDLLERDYIKYQDDKLIRTQKKFESTQDIKSMALRFAHKDILDLGKEKIETVDIDKRYYSSTIFPVKMEKIDQAKKIIREFRDKMSEFMGDEDCEQVYNLSIQLFPLSHDSETKDIIQ